MNDVRKKEVISTSGKNHLVIVNNHSDKKIFFKTLRRVGISEYIK